MTVKELIKLLQGEDQDRIVICQADPEGNGYSPLSSLWAGAYRAETTWRGEAGLELLSDEDRESGFADEDILQGGIPALMLVPVN